MLKGTSTSIWQMWRSISTIPAGVGEHPDIMEAIEQEMKLVAEYHDMLEMTEKYLENARRIQL